MRASFRSCPICFRARSSRAPCRIPAARTPQVAAAGYHEPSLVFLVGTDTFLTDGVGAADFLLKGPCRFALIETRHARSFAQRADAIGLRYTPLPRIEGVNIGGGRNLSIAIFRSGDGS